MINIASKIAPASCVVAVRTIHSAIGQVGVRRNTDNTFKK